MLPSADEIAFEFDKSVLIVSRANRPSAVKGNVAVSSSLGRWFTAFVYMHLLSTDSTGNIYIHEA